MDFNNYQKEALRTDRVPADDDASLIVPMLGLAGETGQLLSEYKKHLRDGEAHRLFKERVSEELGDLLWYISNVASKFDLSLSDIAAANLVKVKHRWASERPEPLIFDAELPDGERLPRRLEVELIDVDEDTRRQVQIVLDGKPFGAELTDNAYDPDGYRFHDVFHFAYAAVLGWSPITRGLLRRKRKSRPLLDEVEDGGRAAVIEEGVVALAFDYCPSPSLPRRRGRPRLSAATHDQGHDVPFGSASMHHRRVGAGHSAGIRRVARGARRARRAYWPSI